MTVTKALWVLHLFATCPVCAGLVELTDDQDFWLDHTEQDVRQGLQLDVTCPACARNFEVVTE